MLKLVIFLMLGYSCSAARILAIIPSPAYSHQVAFRSLWKELVKRGHHLTLITTDPMKEPALKNLTEIDIYFSYEIWNNQMDDIFRGKVTNPIEVFTRFYNFSSQMNDLQLGHPEVKQLIANEKEHFDLVMIENFYPSMFAFSQRFNCPAIGLTSLDATAGIYHIYGNPVHPIVNPDIVLPFIPGKMSFFDRVISVFIVPIIQYLFETRLIPADQRLVEKHFGKDYDADKLMRSACMLFTNSNPIFSQVRPLVPAVIQIGGGTHLTQPKPLPKDLKTYFDEATNGFIYFSLGTNVKSKDLSENVKKAFLEAFAELPYKTVWKFEADLPNKPSNVFISKWFPQQDVFRHPNIKLFITQGGIQSMEEAVYNYVPMVCIPFFGDQPTNAKKMVEKGLGLSLDRQTLDKEILKEVILEVITNSKYRNNAMQIVKLASDQPMTGLEKAVWWTEYVIRHKGAKHLRSPSLDLPTYQYYLLDVIGFCLVILLAVVFALVKIIKFVLKIAIAIFRSKEKTL